MLDDDWGKWMGWWYLLCWYTFFHSYCHRSLIRLSYRTFQNLPLSLRTFALGFSSTLLLSSHSLFSIFSLSQSENLIYLKKYLLNDFNGFSMNRKCTGVWKEEMEGGKKRPWDVVRERGKSHLGIWLNSFLVHVRVAT